MEVTNGTGVSLESYLTQLVSCLQTFSMEQEHFWNPQMEQCLSPERIKQLRMQYGDDILGAALITLSDSSLEDIRDLETANGLVTICCLAVESLGEPLVSRFVRAVGNNSLFRRALLGGPEMQRPFQSEVFLAMKLLRKVDLDEDASLNFRAVTAYPILATWLVERNMLNVQARDSAGRTLLMELMRTSRPTWYINKLAKGLVKQGLNINAVDGDGHNALMYLIQHWWGKTPSLSTVKLLLDLGADAYSVNSSGDSVFLVVSQRRARSPEAFQDRVHELLHYRLLALINPTF